MSGLFKMHSPIKKKLNPSFLHLFLNGIEYAIEGEDCFLSLAQYLREKKNLCGTKIVCSEGDCGACTVLVAKWNGMKGDWLDFQQINSCITPLYLLDLNFIITVEGLQDSSQALNELQQKMCEFHGAQCGYCTPGIICSLSVLAEDCFSNHNPITSKKAKNYLTGNLCRCTGYLPIIEAAVEADLNQWSSLKIRYLTQEKRERCKKLEKERKEELLPLCLEKEQKKIIFPRTLKEAIEIKNQNPYFKIVAGATDLGVLHNKGKLFLESILVLNKIEELNLIKEKENSILIGANVTLSKVEEFCSILHPEMNRLFKIFASPQIKNQGTLLGNILNASPIADSIGPLLVLESVLHLISSTKGKRSVSLEKFYKGYKKIDLAPDEIATGIEIPFLEKSSKSKYYKVSMRKDLDISAVTFAGILSLTNENKIGQIKVALGGVGPVVMRIPEIENFLQNKIFEEESFLEAGELASQLIHPLSDLRGSKEYRLKIVKNLFHKFFTELLQEKR